MDITAEEVAKAVGQEKFRYDLTAHAISPTQLRVFAPHMSLILDVTLKEETLLIEVKQVTLQSEEAERSEQSAMGDFFEDFTPSYYETFPLLAEVALAEQTYTDRMTFEINQDVDYKEEDTPLAEHFSDLLMRELDTITLQLKTLDLTSRVPGLIIERAGGVVPFQSEGTILGYQYYFRYRGGNASLRVGGEDPVGAPLWSAFLTYGDSLGGSLTMKEFTYLFCTLLTHLKKAPFLYRFTLPEENLAKLMEGHNIVDAVVNEIIERYLPIHIYGHSEQDARERLRENEEKIQEMKNQSNGMDLLGYYGERPHFDPDLLVIESEDNREFPEEYPDFRVLDMPEPTAPFTFDEEEY